MRDVIGNKSDTPVTSIGTAISLMAYSKGLINQAASIISEIAKIPKFDGTASDILNKDANLTYDRATDSLEAIADAIDAITVGSSPVPTANSTNNDYTRDVVGNKEDAAATTVGTTKSIVTYIKGCVNQLASLVSDMAKIPKSDGSVTFNSTALASINAEVDTALNTAISTTPTAKSLNDILNKNTSLTYDKSTDSLEAIRDKIDTLSSSDEAVATADDTSNTLMRQVVGNKTDAAQTTVGTTRSIMAYVKGLLSLSLSNSRLGQLDADPVGMHLIS